MTAYTNGSGAAAGLEGPGVETLLTRLLERLDRLEQKLDTLEAAVAQAPGMLAMVTDTVDGLYQQASQAGIDADERLKLALTLVESITEPHTIKALIGLVERATWAEQMAAQAPGLIAMTADTADELYAAVSRQGVDLEETTRRGLSALRDFFKLMQSEEFHALMASGVLDPQTLGVISHAAHAIVKSRDETRRAGIGALLGAPFRPDVQQALGFALAFAGNFGQQLSNNRPATTK